MKIIKRNGTEVKFDLKKIVIAISKANKEVEDIHKISESKIKEIAQSVEASCRKATYAMGVEQIQDMVEKAIMEAHGYEVAQKYVRYRYDRQLKRKANTTDAAILSLIDGENEVIKQENSNKNPTILSVQRDYMAGEVSKDICKRFLYPKDIMDAHYAGIIHVHDMDYSAAHIHNCDLVNLEDMLQNGTQISGTTIDKPHSFKTACNIATQIVAQVASSQFGGQSFSLSHLAPFVDVSRQVLRKEVKEEIGDLASEDRINEIAEKRLYKEIKDSVQLIQYQLITLQTTNG